MSFNKWIGIGNLGRDGELRYTGGGTPVVSFSVACNEVWKDKEGQRQERVEWVRVSYWGKSAEAVAEYLRKGKQVLVEGKLQSRKYEARDGVEKTVWEIRADRVQLLGGGGRRSDGEGSRRRQAEEPQHEAGGYEGPADGAEPVGGGFEDDEVPF